MSQPTDATQEGVSNGGLPLEITAVDQHSVILGRDDSPRDQIEQLASQTARASRDKQLRTAMGLPPEDEPAAVQDTDPAEEMAEPEVAEQDVPVEDPAPAEVDAEPIPEKTEKSPKRKGGNTPPDQMVDVLVDGVKQQMPLSEVVKGFQLEQASRRRFDEAAQMRREAMAYYQAQQAQQQTPGPQRAPAAATAAPAAPQVDLDAVAEKLAYGTKDDIKAALETLVTRPAPAAPYQDPQATVAMTLEAVERRLEAERTQQDLGRFADEYKDIVSDQDLAAAAAKRAEKLMADELLSIGADPQVLARMSPEQVGHWHAEARRLGKASSLGAVFRSAAEQTRQKFGKPTVTAPASAESKVERKRNIPQPPPAASARAPAPQEPRPKTPAEIIAEERKARGLAA